MRSVWWKIWDSCSCEEIYGRGWCIILGLKLSKVYLHLSTFLSEFVFWQQVFQVTYHSVQTHFRPPPHPYRSSRDIHLHRFVTANSVRILWFIMLHCNTFHSHRPHLLGSLHMCRRTHWRTKGNKRSIDGNCAQCYRSFRIIACTPNAHHGQSLRKDGISEAQIFATALTNEGGVLTPVICYWNGKNINVCGHYLMNTHSCGVLRKSFMGEIAYPGRLSSPNECVGCDSD